MTSLLLASLLLAGPWDGCDVQGPAPGVERRIECGGARLSVSVDKPAAAGQAALLEMVDALGTRDAGDDGLREIELDGKLYPARSYAVRAGSAFAVLLPAGEGRVRLAQCEQTQLLRCPPLLATLLRGLPAPAPTKVAASQPLRFGNRRLQVPEGCHSPAPARISCPDAVLTWSHYAKDEEGIFEVSAQALEAGFSKLGDVANAEAECVTAEAPGRCVLLTIRRSDKSEQYTLFGVATVGDEQVAAQCNSRKPFTGAGAPPCAQVFGLPLGK